MTETDESTFGAIQVSCDRHGRERVIHLMRGVLGAGARVIESHRSGYTTELIDLSVDRRSDGVWVEFEMIAGADVPDYVAVVRAIAEALASEGFGHEVQGAKWLEDVINAAGSC